tara:strand:- start:845 stop:1666 length:822 start_codon:yes stop_codon:yes gene_type:complete
MSDKKVKRFKNSILSQDVLSAPKKVSQSSSKSVKPKPQKKPKVSDVNVYELVFDKANLGNRKRNTSKSKSPSAGRNNKTNEIKTNPIKATKSVKKPSVSKSKPSTITAIQKNNPVAVIMAESLAKKSNKIIKEPSSQLKSANSKIKKKKEATRLKSTKVSPKKTKATPKTAAKSKAKIVKSSLAKKKTGSLNTSRNIKKAPVTSFKLVEFKHEHLLDTSQAKLSNGSQRKNGSSKKELVTAVVADKAKYNDLIEAYLDTSNTFVKNWFKLIKY